ncbi:LOW QUALITY PROTEIN: proteasome subunit alpha type-1-like [Ursus americanus]|uniref:LOW QUALITY PROTEIN: proteasome subunit alpha type-1-like n=1 Tax=Ursus americanus TaxID=9643 RepID=UPI001E679FE3|nr:LOW QUALITY PROTEIN: proteasome subunit alpha type-1-like [Ursus americanus]
MAVASETKSRSKVPILIILKEGSQTCAGTIFCNQYDNDVMVWGNPQGKIHQIGYAVEAVKQGSATVGLKSKTHAVLVALKRAHSELVTLQKKKILNVDNHIGISVAGLTVAARLFCNFIRQKCLDSRFVFDRPLSVSCLASLIGSKTQIPTQYGRRPYGAGQLIAGCDAVVPHIFQTCPSINYFDCSALSIGAHSQSAYTYLERHMSGFMEYSLNELVKHGLRALQGTIPAKQDVTTKNVSIGIVVKDLEFTAYDDDDDISPFLEGPEEKPQRQAQPAYPADRAAEKADEPMEH